MTGKPFPFLSTQFDEQQGSFSPDGKRIAYQSDESGRFEIYGTNRQSYDVARDGRFLVDTELQDTSAEPIHLLLNWHPPAK